MKAIILAAGEGSRLGDICKGKPKCLVDIEDNTLLEIHLNTLHSCGIDDISVVRGFGADQINIPGIKKYDNPDYAGTNMLHSLFCAREELTDEVLILYADILYEPQVLRRFIQATHDIAVGVMVEWQEAVRQRSDVALEDLEMIYFDSENRVQEISKNLTGEYDTRGQFIGMVKCSVRGTEILKRNYDRAKQMYSGKSYGQVREFEKAWLTDILQEMTAFGVPIHCVIIERGWMEIDTPEDYERALTDTQFVRRLIKIKTDWRKRSETYNSLDWVSRDELLSAIVEMSDIAKGQKILDLGTGTGKVLMALKERCGDASFYGVDICQSMLDKIEARHGFNLSLGDMKNLQEFADDKFDLVTARMVCHHATDVRKAMTEMHRVLRKGGKFIICEGNPPDRSCIPFYESMFRFKEDRITFLLDDLVNLLVRQGFENITSRTVMLKDMSLNNWLEKSGLPFRNIDIITKMHRECDAHVRDAYNMTFLDNDIMMNWKFSVVSGIKC